MFPGSDRLVTTKLITALAVVAACSSVWASIAAASVFRNVYIHPAGVVHGAWVEGLIEAVPGPTTLGLFALGLGVLFYAGRRAGSGTRN
jgi:hypothetical protein